MTSPHILESVLERVKELEGLQAWFATEYGRTLDGLRAEVAVELAQQSGRPQDLAGIVLEPGSPFISEKRVDGRTVPTAPVVAPIVAVHTEVDVPGGGRKSGNYRSFSVLVPEKGFIVNMSRLISMQEIFRLLHEFVKSTAIAALTLVAGGSETQVRNTVAFLVFMFLLFDDHERKYDRFDISDLSLLTDFYPAEPTSENPNQVLKALSVATSLPKRVWGWILNISTASALFVLWQTLSFFYQVQSADNAQDLLENVRLSGFILDDAKESFENDFEVMSMQAIVFSIMYFCCSVFDLLTWYELRLSTPEREDGTTWDVRKHGKPSRFALGMPSMWFTSTSARADLLRWVNALHPFEKVLEVFPEELAILAFEGGDAMRERVAVSLKNAMYWDALKQETDNTRLNVDFRFFCDQVHVPGMPFPGDYLKVGTHPED